MLPVFFRAAWPCAAHAVGHITHIPAATWKAGQWKSLHQSLGDLLPAWEKGGEMFICHFSILVPSDATPGDGWATSKYLFSGLSFSIFQEWLLQAPNCGCVWEWQLPSALQSTGIRHCSVLAGGSSLSCAGWELDHPWSQVGTRMALTKGDPWKWPLLSNWGVVK